MVERMGLRSLDELRAMPEWDIITWLIRKEVPHSKDVQKALAYRRRQNKTRQEKGLKEPKNGWKDSYIGLDQQADQGQGSREKKPRRIHKRRR